MLSHSRKVDHFCTKISQVFQWAEIQVFLQKWIREGLANSGETIFYELAFRFLFGGTKHGVKYSVVRLKDLDFSHALAVHSQFIPSLIIIIKSLCYL